MELSLPSSRFWLNRGAVGRIIVRTVTSAPRIRRALYRKLESPMNTVMNAVQIEQKSFEMTPREGISIAQFLTVTDFERSARYYEKVFGARILSLGDGNAPGYLQLANIWMILNVGGGPTPDKPTVTLSVPDPNHINSFMNFRVADIEAAMNCGKAEEPSSLRSRSPSTARRVATSAILTDILSKSDRAPTSRTVNPSARGCRLNAICARRRPTEASELRDTLLRKRLLPRFLDCANAEARERA